MLKAGKRVVCAACGSQNNPKWEFCVRCGETLRAAEPERPRLTASPTRHGAVRRPLPLGAILGFGVLAVGAVFLVKGWKPTGPRVDPAVFTFATTPPPPAAPGPTLSPRPGSEAFRKGLGLAQAGKAEEALSFLAEAVEQGPDVAEYHGAYAQALWEAKKVDEALQQAQTAARLAPVPYQLVFARFLAHAGKAEAAARQYEALAAAEPQNFEAVKEAGVAFGEAKDLVKATEYLRRAAALRPDNPEGQRGLGWALEKSGDRAGAIDAYQKAVTLAPALPVARIRLAELLFEQGKKEDAIRTYREGIDRDPQSPLLQVGLAGVLDRAGRAKEAAAAYREYVKLAPEAPDAKASAARANRLDPEQPATAPAGS